MPWEYLRVVSLVVYISNSQCLTKNMRIRRGTEPGNPLLPGFFSSLPSAYVHTVLLAGSQGEAKWKEATHKAHIPPQNFNTPAFAFPLSTCADWWMQTGDFAATTGILPSCRPLRSIRSRIHTHIRGTSSETLESHSA